MPDFPKRRSPRRHRPMRGVDAETLISLLGGDLLDFHRKRVAAGYELRPGYRSYRRRDGLVSLTFVWRDRGKGIALAWSYRVMYLPAGAHGRL